jgi:hypothetical protein
VVERSTTGRCSRGGNESDDSMESSHWHRKRYDGGLLRLLPKPKPYEGIWWLSASQ